MREKVKKAGFGEKGCEFREVAEPENSQWPGASLVAVASNVVPTRVRVLRERRRRERVRDSSQERFDGRGSLARLLRLLHQVANCYDAVPRRTVIRHAAQECREREQPFRLKRESATATRAMGRSEVV